MSNSFVDRDAMLRTLVMSIRKETFAAVCNDLLVADQNEELTDVEAERAEALFHLMLEEGAYRWGHEAVEIVTGG